MADRALLIEKSDGDIQRKRARLSGTRPNLSNWQGGRNLNTGGNKVQRAGAYNNQGSMQQPKGKLATQQIQQVLGYKLTCSYCGKLGIILILAGGRKGNVVATDPWITILENDAACWWDIIDSKWTEAQTVRTWELIKTEFNKNYVPRSVKLKREAEFLNFEQGNLTVQQYATKFTSLA
ncbi:hypothetical protein RJ640_029102 [Escallonia rubra]|uniref:Retrotransposon gag domain-containing protein n=1 Tax=Escallonia rubra TaxID=112253 RepID=A0AA88RF89_9ASTE|nr:hypothetical protein RJ640_029102 [Escallonia rubra]